MIKECLVSLQQQSAAICWQASASVPGRQWESISTDLVKLPAKAAGCNSILVFVDRPSKMAHFVPTTEMLYAQGLCCAFCPHCCEAALGFLPQRHNKICHFISGIKNYFRAGKGRPQTNQPNSQAGG